MNTDLRKKINVKVALESALTQTRTFDDRPFTSEPAKLASNVNVKAVSSQMSVVSFRNKLRQQMVKFARLCYGLVQPLVRPIAWRGRSFLIDGLRSEVQHTAASNIRQVQLLIDKSQELTSSRFNGELQKIATQANAMLLEELHSRLEKVRLENQNLALKFNENIDNLLNTKLDHFRSQMDRLESYSYTAVRRLAVNCDPGELLIRTNVGFLLCASSDHALVATLLENGELEPGTRLLIQKFLGSEDVYVDVGANVGMHMLAAGSTMLGRGKLIGFEPFAKTKAMLERTLWINGLSEISEVYGSAVSNFEGHRSLFLGETSGHHSLFQFNKPTSQSTAFVEVPVVKLDSVIKPDQRVDLLKIDAEGAEMEVIEGGLNMIQNNPDIALIVEFGPSHIFRAGKTIAQWFLTFENLGLTYLVINSDTGELESWTQERLESVQSVNLFFSLPRSKAWAKLR